MIFLNLFTKPVTVEESMLQKLILLYLFTYSMEQSPSWKANWFSPSEETPCILWNLKVHHRI